MIYTGQFLLDSKKQIQIFFKILLQVWELCFVSSILTDIEFFILFRYIKSVSKLMNQIEKMFNRSNISLQMRV
jgi:hypothetical protein